MMNTSAVYYNDQKKKKTCVIFTTLKINMLGTFDTMIISNTITCSIFATIIKTITGGI